jgi:ADP-ribose pyrophosphatase YjhB (NUDIX family)
MCDPAISRLVNAAVQARSSGPAYLEDGHVPAARAAMIELGLAPGVHSGGAWDWTPTLPAGVDPVQSWGWLFSPDGRVLVLVDGDGHLSLPGGTIESGETLEQTLIREVWEEARASIGSVQLLGFLRDAGPQPCGEQEATRFRARMAALLNGLGQAGVDPATGGMCRRVLMPIGLVNELMGWGANGQQQVAAAQRAAQAWGLDPVAAPPEATEVPEHGLAL